MTEDDERRALRGIEDDLTRADPAFAARMTTPRRFPAVSVLCAVTYIVLPIEGLLAGPRVALLTLLGVAVVVALILLRRRLRRKRP